MKTVQARWYTKGRTAPIRVIVCHDMEAPEKATTAEAVANYFATTSTKASAHVSVDNDSAVRSVSDADTAWAAPGCNHDGLQLEIAGYMRQTRAEWLDAFSTAALGQAAKVAAAWATKYAIPVRKLSVTELRAGLKGFVGHVDVSNAYQRSDHGDPGPNFPWQQFLAMVRAEMSGDAPPATTPPPGRLLKLAEPLMHGDDVKAIQRLLNSHGAKLTVDGVYGPRTATEVKTFQKTHKLVADGVVGPKTRAALAA